MSRFVLHRSSSLWGDVTGTIKVFPLRSEISVMRPPRQHGSIYLAFKTVHYAQLNHESLAQTLQLLHGMLISSPSDTHIQIGKRYKSYCLASLSQFIICSLNQGDI